MRFHRERHSSFWIIISLIVLSSFARAQYQLSIEVDYVAGFNSEAIRLHHAKVKNTISNGYHLAIVQGIGFSNIKFEPTLKIGMKHLYTSSEVNEISFQASTYKLALAPGVRYKIDSIIRIGLFLGIENNLDFEEFRTKRSDLFRYTLHGDFQYALFRRFYLTVTYETVIFPIRDHYLFINPQHQIRLGVTYQIL